MADYFYSTLGIGGILPADAVGELLKRMEESHVRLESAGRVKTVEALRAALTEGEALWLVDEQAPYGEFPHIEDFCRTHGLAYERSHDGYFETPPMCAWWRPGMARPENSERTGDGDVSLPAPDIERALEADTDAERVAAIRTLLDRARPPELPAFQIAPHRSRGRLR